MIACEESQEVIRDTLEEGRVSNPVSSHCTQRYFERLPGYVDIDVITTDGLETLNAEPIKTAVCCSRTLSADPSTHAVLESLISYQSTKRTAEVKTDVSDLKKLIDDYNDTPTRKANIECSMDALKAFYKELEKAESKLE